MENNPELISISVAFILNIINFAIAIILINYAKSKIWNQFLKIIFGGMAIRMLLILSSVIIGIKIFNLSIAYFSISLAIFYFLMLLMEIIYLNYQTNFVNLQNKNQQKAK